MKKILLLGFCLCSMFVIAQTKVAVYVNGSDDIDGIVKQILGSEIAAAISSNSQYIAEDKTADFTSAAQQEQGDQSVTKISDSQLVQLCAKLGAQQVCVVNIMPYQSQFYIQVKMLDAEKASTVVSCREVSALQNIDEIVSVAEKLSQKLVTTKPEHAEPMEVTKEEPQEQQEQLAKQEEQPAEQEEPQQKEPEIVYSNDYSKVGKQSDAKCDIISIDNTKEYTVVSFKYVSIKESSLSFSKKGYIIDQNGTKYPVISVDGIGTYSSTAKPAGITSFTVTFAKIPSSTTAIAITEGVKNGWTWEQIALKPYGMKDYFLFNDKSASKLQEMQMKQSSEKFVNAIQDLADLIASYSIIVVNAKSHPYEIEIDGKSIGIAKANSVTTLRAPVTQYGTLKAKQMSGYLLFPTTYQYNVTKQKVGASITIRF